MGTLRIVSTWFVTWATLACIMLRMFSLLSHSGMVAAHALRTMTTAHTPLKAVSNNTVTADITSFLMTATKNGLPKTRYTNTRIFLSIVFGNRNTCKLTVLYIYIYIVVYYSSTIYCTGSTYSTVLYLLHGVYYIMYNESFQDSPMHFESLLDKLRNIFEN